MVETPSSQAVKPVKTQLMHSCATFETILVAWNNITKKGLCAAFGRPTSTIPASGLVKSTGVNQFWFFDCTLCILNVER